mgnify:FL=1
MSTIEESLAAAVKAESTPDWSEVPGQAFDNAPESAGRLVSGIWDMITNPVDTAVAVGSLAGGIASKLVPGLELDETGADAFGKFIVERYGGDEGDAFAGLRRTLAKDPVGALADLSAAFTGGSTVAAKAAMLASKTVKPVLSAADKAARSISISKALENTPVSTTTTGPGSMGQFRQFRPDNTPVSRTESLANKVGNVSRTLEGAADTVIKGEVLSKIPGRTGSAIRGVAAAAPYLDPVGGPIKAVGGALKGLDRPDAKMLLEEGVSPTMGQTLGGLANQLEETVGTVPVLGSAIAAGRKRANSQFNLAARNRALNPIGETSDIGAIGDAGIYAVKDKLSIAYDNILKKVMLTPDGQLMDDIADVVSEAKKNIGPDASSSLDRIIENQVIPHIDAPIMGEKFKEVTSALGGYGRNFGKSPDPDHRIVGNAVSKVRKAFKNALARTNPNHASRLDSIDEGFANYARLRATQKAVKSGEDPTPSQLATGVRSEDKSVGQGASATGTALMQDLSSAGMRVLGDKVRSSGTMERGAVLGVGGAAATGTIPFVEPMTAALMAASAVPYAPGVQGLMARALLSRAKPIVKAGEAVDTLGPRAMRGAYQSTQPDREEDRLLEERLRRAAIGQ